MKRLFFILLFFGALLFLASCQKEYGILEYQEKDIIAECLVNGEYKIQLEKTKELCKITVLEPQNASGISFEIGEGIYAIYGDMKIQTDKDSLKGICAISEIFSQSEECLTTAVKENEGSVLTFQKDSCTYKLTLGRNSLPKQVSILSENFEYQIDVLSIELK